MEGSTYRDRIDEIDRQMVELFARRMEVAAEIARYKKEKGLPVQDLRREKEKLLAVAEASPEVIREYTPRLYTVMMELSRSYQQHILGREDALTQRIRNAIQSTGALFPDGGKHDKTPHRIFRLAFCSCMPVFF